MQKETQATMQILILGSQDTGTFAWAESLHLFGGEGRASSHHRFRYHAKGGPIEVTFTYQDSAPSEEYAKTFDLVIVAFDRVLRGSLEAAIAILEGMVPSTRAKTVLIGFLSFSWSAESDRLITQNLFDACPQRLLHKNLRGRPLADFCSPPSYKTLCHLIQKMGVRYYDVHLISGYNLFKPFEVLANIRGDNYRAVMTYQ